MTNFLGMGGYWAFVWPAYGFAALVMVALVVASLRALRQAESALAVLERERPRGSRR